MSGASKKADASQMPRVRQGGITCLFPWLVTEPARLDSVVKAVVRPDGKFLYASSWKLSSVLTFARDPQTGKLELKQTITDADNLDGVTGLALSLDDNLAIATAFRPRAAVLYLRNHQG
jgi:hypothetical protein